MNPPKAITRSPRARRDRKAAEANLVAQEVSLGGEGSPGVVLWGLVSSQTLTQPPSKVNRYG